MKLDIEKFNPTVAELTVLADGAKQVTVTDLRDQTQLAVAKTKQKELQKARTSITKISKKLRSEANDIIKQVLSKEKELLALVLPEEDRLKRLDEEAKYLAIIDERLKVLPERKKRIIAVWGQEERVSEELLLGMDDNAFEAYFNEMVRKKNQR